ncbi:MAG: metal-binding protein [Clostridium perfringens]|nr:metal-binding protein [Clostridium perfringens]
MASGKTHDKITLIFSPLVALIFLLLNIHFFSKNGAIFLTIIGVASYIFGGYMFSGDLDIKSNEFKRWGKLRFIWVPYQRFFKHRSIFSHGFILGPLIRILYLYLIFIIIFSVLYSFSFISISPPKIIRENIKFILNNDKIFFNIFVALFFGSGLHTITDLISTSIKKNASFKKKKYKRKKVLKK